MRIVILIPSRMFNIKHAIISLKKKQNKPSFVACPHPFCYYLISPLQQNSKVTVSNEIHSVSHLSAQNSPVAPPLTWRKGQSPAVLIGPVASLTSLVLLSGQSGLLVVLCSLEHSDFCTGCRLSQNLFL